VPPPFLPNFFFEGQKQSDPNTSEAQNESRRDVARRDEPPHVIMGSTLTPPPPPRAGQTRLPHEVFRFFFCVCLAPALVGVWFMVLCFFCFENFGVSLYVIISHRDRRVNPPPGPHTPHFWFFFYERSVDAPPPSPTAARPRPTATTPHFYLLYFVHPPLCPRSWKCCPPRPLTPLPTLLFFSV